MPLRCLSNDADVLAFELSPEEWENLRKENSQNHHLRLPCCNSRVVLKTSRLGTQFFSHARKGDCTSASETPEHLLAKSLVADAAKQAGWSVITEYRGATPEGDDWIADVYAARGNAKVALEIQWSPQDEETTRYRQERYQKSGVRALWLMRQSNILIDPATPTFHLAFDQGARTFAVHLPNPVHYRPEFMTSRIKGDSLYWRQCLLLDAFIVGALNKRLRYLSAKSMIGQSVPIQVWGAGTKCWRCSRPMVVVTSLVLQIGVILPGMKDIRISFDELRGFKQISVLREQIFNPDTLRKNKIGNIRLRYSQTLESNYLANGCVHCDALSGAHFEQRLRDYEKPIYTVPTQFGEEWVTIFDRLRTRGLSGWLLEEAGSPI